MITLSYSFTKKLSAHHNIGKSHELVFQTSQRLSLPKKITSENILINPIDLLNDIHYHLLNRYSFWSAL
jgi:hypothetical protein